MEEPTATPRSKMSHSRALNEDEVVAEMKKMVAFIKQEAIEKAREIKVKADEEFNIEKAKLVRHESINIEAAFQRKIKQAEVQKRIAHSNLINQSRLKVLQSRQNYLDELFAEAREKLQNLCDNQPKYKKLVEDLILQGLYLLMDADVTIVAKSSERGLVDGAIKVATQQYTKTTKQPVNVIIDKNEVLPQDSAGGIILHSHGGRIRVNNTLEERLLIAEDQMLPEIRLLLFGASPNRKFFN